MKICQVSTQRLVELVGDSVLQAEFPPADSEVLPGIKWEHCCAVFSPAYWAGQAWLASCRGRSFSHRLGETVIEEAAACLLGGHGIPAEVGLAAFSRMRERGFFTLEQAVRVHESDIHAELCEPLRVRNRSIRYRFAGQKARALAPLLRGLAQKTPEETDHLRFRDELLGYRGIGPKTASWITRNWLDSDRVAILDIHVIRAGILCGIFPFDAKPERSYFALEARFLAFASALGVRASLLDALMWRQLRQCPISVRAQLSELEKSVDTRQDWLPS
ncbi:MAG: 8-oxoguanine DNA glycosylase [Verrucomicrobia bacterium]|nr:8-oxoguanine DNA glycosylase [Verrucomicrobiota bacterium]